MYKRILSGLMVAIMLMSVLSTTVLAVEYNKEPTEISETKVLAMAEVDAGCPLKFVAGSPKDISRHTESQFLPVFSGDVGGWADGHHSWIGGICVVCNRAHIVIVKNRSQSSILRVEGLMAGVYNLTDETQLGYLSRSDIKKTERSIPMLEFEEKGKENGDSTRKEDFTLETVDVWHTMELYTLVGDTLQLSPVAESMFQNSKALSDYTLLTRSSMNSTKVSDPNKITDFNVLTGGKTSVTSVGVRRVKDASESEVFVLVAYKNLTDFKVTNETLVVKGFDASVKPSEPDPTNVYRNIQYYLNESNKAGDFIPAEETGDKVDDVIDESLNHWDELTTYQKWEISLNRYDLYNGKDIPKLGGHTQYAEMSEASTAKDAKFYRVKPMTGKASYLYEDFKRGDPASGNTNPYGSAMTADQVLYPEEMLRLYAYLEILHSSRFVVKDVAGNNVPMGGKEAKEYDPTSLKERFYTTDKDISMASRSAVGNSSSVSPIKAKEEATKVAQNMTEQLSSVADRAGIVNSFDALSRWGTAKVFGYTMAADKGDTDPNKLPNNVSLDNLYNGLSNLGTVKIDMVYGIPEMSSLTLLDSTSDAYEAYRNLCYLVMISGDWAARSSDSGIECTSKVVKVYDRDEFEVARSKCKNPTLETFLALNENLPREEKEKVQVDTAVSKWIKIYAEIYEGLTYLGVSPEQWAIPQIGYIFDVYSRIEPYLNNSSIKEYRPLDGTDPLIGLFSTKDKMFSDNYLKGVALSAGYVPMQTNLYDPNSLTLLDNEEWVNEFHYPYGFHRKALYIDTNINAAVDYYVSTAKGVTRVATLGDLLETDKDIVLYLDDNMYNVHKLAEIQGYAYNKMQNTDEAGKDKLGADWLTDMLDISVESVCKTGGNQKYSDAVSSKAREYDDNSVKIGDIFNFIDANAILRTDQIKTYIKPMEYTPMQPFALVSAIYRYKELYNLLQKQNIDQKPVFISSKNLAGVNGVNESGKLTLLNYSLLKNLPANMGIDYKTSLDKKSLIYMDVYGNIVTESGLVVIPSAANTTLHKPTGYEPMNSAFIGTYGKLWYIPSDYPIEAQWLDKYFSKNEASKIYELRAVSNIQVPGQGEVTVSLRNLPVSDKNVMRTFHTIYEGFVHGPALDFDSRCWLVVEVLRGAPLENLDKKFEGLSGITDINTFGTYLAYKLETLSEQLISNSNGNSMITLPNLAFMEGVEYIVLFGFKILFAVMIFVLIYRLYVDAMSHTIGIKTIGNFLGTLLLFVIGVMTVPALLNTSYYGVNKALLQDEAKYVALLNMEKNAEGRELGITSVQAPTSTTQLYIKIDELTVPWYAALGKVLSVNSIQTMEQIYEEALDKNPLSNLPGIEKKANGLYMNVEYLFDTSSIEFEPARKYIRHVIHETPTASYVLPYYVILEHLTTSVNSYNISNNISSYTTKLQDRGTVKTVGMIEPYLTSKVFMNQKPDVVGMRYIYEQEMALVTIDSKFNEEDLEKMRASLWYNRSELTAEELKECLDKLDESAKVFVAKNKNLLGKITDESFLKMMALSVALEHNNIFKVPSAKAIEIMDMDSKDIIRMSLAPKQTVMEQSSSSFSRFVYENGGTLSVVTVALLIAIYFVSSMIKPVVMFVVLGSMIASILFRKVMMKSSDKSIEGYLTTMGLLCGTNLIYAGLLKLSLMLPTYGLTPVVCVIVQILLQLAYFIVMGVVVLVVLRDWQSMGYNYYSKAFGNIGTVMSNNVRMIGHKVTMTNERYDAYSESRSLNDITGKRKTRGLTGSTYFDRMKERDAKRRNKRK